MCSLNSSLLLVCIAVTVGCVYDNFNKVDGAAATGGNSGNTGGTTTSPGGTSQTPVGGTGAINLTGGTAATQACKATFDPAPKVPVVTSLDANAVARAAVVVGSCSPDDGVDRNATHLWSANRSDGLFYDRFVTQLTCLANSACGCGAFEQCLGMRFVTSASTCSGGCSGTRFTLCNGDFETGYQLEIDCSRIGQACDSRSICAAEPSTSCDNATYTDNCDSSGRPQKCENDFASDFVVRKPSCTSLGLDCTAGTCVGRGASCTSSLEPISEGGFEGTSCSGRNLTACVNGKSTTIDCATLGPGFACQTRGTQYFCGLANQCSPPSNGTASQTDPPSCNGTVLTFCNAGRLEHIDCSTLGFSGCEVNRNIDRYGCIDPLHPTDWKAGG